jgi:hypothetical protein
MSGVQKGMANFYGRVNTRLSMFENRVLKRIFGPKTDEITKAGENCMIGSFIIRVHEILLG